MLDVVAGKDTKTRQWLQEHIADPLYRAKAAYSAEVKTQLDTLKTNVADKLGIRKGSRESAAVMWLGEGRKIETYNKKSGEITYSSYSLEKLKADFPTSWQKIVAAEQYIRGVYDAYVGRINESLARIYPNVEQNAQAELDKLRLRAEQLRTDAHQMEEGVRRGEYAQSSLDSLVAEAQTVGARVAALQKKIDTGEIFKNKRLTPRNDYFHHFMEMEQGLGALKNLLRKSHDIDPALVGVSDFTKPKSKWQGFLQERSGGVYVEDAIGGLIKYIPQAEYSININPVVAEYRGVIKALATATKQTRNANGFIEWMTDYTNDLAGKTNPLDRAMQKLVSRKSLQALKWINGRVKSNAIMGNINSAVSQFFNIPNASLYVKNPAIWAKGFKDYARYLMSDADTRAALEQSGFMRERYLNNSVSQFDDKTVLNSPRRFAEWMLEFGDKEAARLIWFAAYEQGLARGDVDVIQYADDITRRSVAGRGIGEVPLAQKSELVKLIAPFQVEVSNAWYAFTERVKLGDMPAIASFLASSYLMNAISRALTGRTVSMDLIQTIIDIMQEAGAGDDDEEKTAGQIAALAATRLGGEMLGNMPFGTQIGSIITGGDDTKAQRLFGETDPTRFGTGNIGLEALLNPVIDSASNLAEGKPADFDAMSYITNFALPFGGKQMDRSLKMAQALGWVPKDGILGTPIGGEKQDMAASYSDSGRLRFPIDDSDPMNVLAGLLFGEWATKEGKGYLDGGTNTYSDKKTAQVEQAAAMGIEPNVFIDYLDSADADGNGSISRAESRNYLQEEVDAFTRAQQAFIWSTAGSGISETQQAEIDKAERVGISETDYLLMLMLANEDGEGKLRQDEAQAYIDEYLRGLTTAQKRFLWQSTTGTTSTKNNPY